MANQDDKKKIPDAGDKFEKAAQIGSLVLGALLTSLQIYYTIRHSANPSTTLPIRVNRNKNSRQKPMIKSLKSR